MTTISHWGTDPLCTIGRFNEQPMVTLWNTLVRFKDAEFRGEKPLLYLLQQVEQNLPRTYCRHGERSFS